MDRIRIFVCACLVVVASSVFAGPAAARHSQAAVDMVTLKSGRTIRGVIVRAHADGSLTMAVSREWLRKANLELLARQRIAEIATSKAALAQLRDRLKQAIMGLADNSRMSTFVRSEAKRVERMLGEPNPPEPRFVWLDLTKKEIARIKPTTDPNRRIACWSWSERLSHVETRDGNDLARELRQKGIDPARPLPDLSDEFPPRTQDDKEWSARLALVEYALDKPLDFQGTGHQLVPVDHSAKAQDTGPLVAKIFGGQLEGVVKDLLGDGRTATAGPSDDGWLKSAFAEAERQRLRAFRATRVDLNLGGQQASVYSVFAVRLDNGNWQILWSGRESQDGVKQRPDVEATIAEDPQLKSALAGFKSLGVAADDQIRQAIRFGAATMEAQKAVDRRFFAFEEPLLRRLDGPPLWW